MEEKTTRMIVYVIGAGLLASLVYYGFKESVGSGATVLVTAWLVFSLTWKGRKKKGE